MAETLYKARCNNTSPASKSHARRTRY